MNHTQWGLDQYAPKHVLHPGQRFWRDGTPDEAEAIMRKRIKGLRCDAEYEAKLIAAARGGEGEFQKGWPMLDGGGRDD